MKKRLFSGILVGIVMLSLTFNFAIAFQKNNAINDINSYNNVEKLDDKSCLIHCGDAFFKKDLLMTKEDNLDKFDYKIFDNNSKKEVYNLSTAKNIIFNDGKVSSIYNNYALAWAIISSIKDGKNLGEAIADKGFNAITTVQLVNAVTPLLADIAACLAGENVFLALPTVLGMLSASQAVSLCIAGGAVL